MKIIRFDDIIIQDEVQDEPLDIICDRIFEYVCFDKVGRFFSRIKKTHGIPKDRSLGTVLAFLNDLEKLTHTSKLIGYSKH